MILNIAEDFADQREYQIKRFRFKNLDRFGHMLNFHIERAITYKTKIGSVFTVLFLSALTAAFLIYFQKYFDKENPSVRYSSHNDKTASEGNILENELAFTFYFENKTTGQFMPAAYIIDAFDIMAYKIIGYPNTGPNYAKVP